MNPLNRGILKLCLQTRELASQRAFYTQTLNLKLTRDEPETITVAAGGTELTFVETRSAEPIYHFAFNIPENKLAAAIAWLEARTPLHREPDGTLVHEFRSWNAHAVYFFDPAGNILELIARHGLNNAAPSEPTTGVVGPFTPRDILYASEIGIVVDDVADAVAAAKRDWDFDVFGGSKSDDFAAVGTDEALLIFAKRGRPWFGGEGRQAGVFGTTAVFYGERNKSLAIGNMPYSLKMLASESIGPNAA